jgi:hypothetical protein
VFEQKLTDILNVKLELGAITVKAKKSDALHTQSQLSDILEPIPSSGVLVVDEASRCLIRFLRVAAPRFDNVFVVSLCEKNVLVCSCPISSYAYSCPFLFI